MQNVRQHHFPEPWGEGGIVGQIAHRGSGNIVATLYEFDENDRFFTASCDPYVGHTPRLFFYTFHHKNDVKDGFEENA
jgi:hypothetical protein